MDPKPFFPPRTPFPEDFPAITRVDSSFAFDGLNTISKALDKMNIEVPVEIGFIAPEKTVHLPDSFGERSLASVPY